jgi:hypothetical protein
MIFDKSQVEDLIKQNLSSAEKRQSGKINISIAAALDEMMTLMQPRAMVRKQEVSISTDDRTKTLSGINNDLNQIYYLKYGTGDEQAVLEFVSVSRFLDLYDNPSADSGVPTKYTIIESSSGFPVVKFDVPAEEADTLIVYYFVDPDPDMISHFRSAAAIVHGALAFFWGTSTEKGAVAHGNFKSLIKAAREADNWHHNPNLKFTYGTLDRAARVIIQDLTDGRY